MEPLSHGVTQPSKWIHILTVVLWSGTFVWLAVTIFWAVSQAWGYDGRFFWASARTFLDGGDPLLHYYSYPGVDLSGHTQFVGLPWVTLLTIPFALLPLDAGLRAWTIFNVCLLLLILGAVYFLSRKELASWQLALLTMCCLWLCLRCVVMGQIGLLVTVAVLLGMISWQSEKWLLSGLCLSLTLFKPWIAVGAVLTVVLIVIVRRKWRFIFGLLLGGSSLLLLTTVIWPQWLNSLLQVDFAFAYGVQVDGHYIVYWPVATLPDFMKFVLGWSVDENGLLVSRLLPLALILALGLLAIQRWRYRRADVLLLIGTGTLLSALVVPYSRFYDYTILSLWAVGIFVGGKRSGVATFTLGLVATLVGLAFILNLGTHPEPWVYQILLWMYVANALVLWKLPPIRDQGSVTHSRSDFSKVEAT